MDWVAHWESFRKLAKGTTAEAQIEQLYREALGKDAREQHARKHRRSPGGLRARRRERREQQAAGYCRHGVYVGGCGIDWMCGTCENGPHWASSSFSKSERVRLQRAWEEREALEAAYAAATYAEA